MKQLKFQFPWRSYQKRILDELEDHLDDDCLHIVAAPGSGKTILGLEVMRQLGLPTLILAPTITIRNQWVERLSMFTDDKTETFDWVSKDLKKPKELTVITYQALHAAFAGEKEQSEIGEDIAEEEEDDKKAKSTKKKKGVDVVSLLKKQKTSVIILDEAHHLRKEWWKALMKLRKELKGCRIIALTATPPYDVEFTEWQKYQDLCGPIDAEIPIPELVLQGDLCPHQDYIHFSLPQGQEAEKIQQFKTDIWSFLEDIKLDENFLSIFQDHPWVHSPEEHIEDILEEPAFFSSMIIFLNTANIPPPRSVLKILGIGKKDIPPLDTKWLETLFTGLLYTHAEHLQNHKEMLDGLRTRLKRMGAIERKRVIIDNTKAVQKLLLTSLGKLDSILDITRAESAKMQDRLRMVILADYIRKDELPGGVGQEKPINKIGVIPIFEYLRRASIQGVKLGVLTGSLIIIPKTAKDALIIAAKQNHIDESHLRFTNVLHDDNYIRVDIRGENRQKIVHLITDIFNQGAITALVGTQALLGEGWDAPSINTLILASYVGSYMLSNQMRGRAIRINPDQPDKVANIWHLVALDIETLEEKIKTWVTGESKRQYYFDPFADIKQDLGHDIKTLFRRFKAFEGVSMTDPPKIENGLGRMALPQKAWDKAHIRSINKDMLDRAKNRDRLPELWQNALHGKSPQPDMRENIRTNCKISGLAFADTLKYMVMNTLVTASTWASYVFQVETQSARTFAILLLIGFSILLCISVPKLLKALWLFLRNGSIAGSVKQVGYCVIDTLVHMDIIRTSPRKIKLRTLKDKMGVVYCRVEGASNIETRYIIEAIQEILSPVDNPRYLMMRRSKLGAMLQVDYHAVPKSIGQHKKYATYFSKCWNKYIGGSEFVYTRSVEGRKILLQARTKALSSAFRKKTDKISIWE